MASETVERLRAIQWHFASHRVLTVAARTGLLRRLAAGPASAATLAADLDLDPLAAGKVVRVLCAQGLVTADGETYTLEAELVPLFAEGVYDYAPALEHSHDLYERWGATLEDWVRTGQMPPRRPTPEGSERFADAMWANAGVLAADLVEVLDLSGVRRVLDLGGSTGRIAVALCQAAPELEVTVVDRSEAIALGPQRVAPTGVGDRVHFVAGDYHEADLGGGWDLVLLSNVLHQELAPAAAALVARAAAALRAGGRVAVVEFAIDEAQRESVSGALFAVNMRSFGDCWPESTIHGWLGEAGLTGVETTMLGPSRWLVTGRK